jgi:hypothetical protein
VSGAGRASRHRITHIQRPDHRVAGTLSGAPRPCRNGSTYGTPRSVSHGCGRPRRFWPGARSGRPAVVRDDDVCALAIAAGSEREPIVCRRARSSSGAGMSSRPVKTPTHQRSSGHLASRRVPAAARIRPQRASPPCRLTRSLACRQRASARPDSRVGGASKAERKFVDVHARPGQQTGARWAMIARGRPPARSQVRGSARPCRPGNRGRRACNPVG